MRKFRVFVHGENFFLRNIEPDDLGPYGFYVTAHVEAETSEGAEFAAVNLLRSTQRLRENLDNPKDDPPRMLVEKIETIEDWPTDCSLPLTGIAFYKEGDDE